jgi:hypothetical protein
MHIEAILLVGIVTSNELTERDFTQSNTKERVREDGAYDVEDSGDSAERSEISVIYFAPAVISRNKHSEWKYSFSAVDLSYGSISQ